VSSILYGLTAGSFANTWPGVLREVQNSTGQIEIPMVFSFLSMGRGFGNIVSGPVGKALLQTAIIGDHGLYGTQCGSLVLFTGISAAFGGSECWGGERDGYRCSTIL